MMQLVNHSPAWLIEICRFLFFGAAGTLLYVWVLYPLVLAILPARRARPRITCQEAEPTAATAPPISLVVSAYNEEGAIEAKIGNFLQSDYPGRSELLIASDGSSDRTVAIASRFISDRVHLFAEVTNRGKGAALSRVLPLVRGEIVVFSDATSIFSRDALNHLIAPFADPEVGLVTGSVQVQGNHVAGMYRRYENLLEKLEARGGSISTAHGCIYAMRRSLLHDHDPTLTDDFVQPILVTLQGSRVAVAPQAVCYESFSPDRTVQFQRQVRMVALASSVYFRFVPALLLTRQWRLLFVLTSHKFLRWLTVPVMVPLVLATVLLVGSSPLFTLALGAEALSAALVALGALFARAGIENRTVLFWDFIEMNFAASVGIAKSIAGRVPSSWSTSSRPLPNRETARASVTR
jgi:cellulose synthase/poly-beta-1,6-N-acetylglucosamine synthase-like glycosyltransferase